MCTCARLQRCQDQGIHSRHNSFKCALHQPPIHHPSSSLLPGQSLVESGIFLNPSLLSFPIPDSYLKLQSFSASLQTFWGSSYQVAIYLGLFCLIKIYIEFDLAFILTRYLISPPFPFLHSLSSSLFCCQFPLLVSRKSILGDLCSCTFDLDLFN